MQYATTINDASVYGITAAREARNAALPPSIEQDGEQVPNPDLIASDSGYLDFVLASAIESWCRQYAPVVVPEVPPAVVAGVPQSVTRRQARQALILAGLFDLVQPRIDAIADATQRALMQSEWDDSQVFERQRPALLLLAGEMGLTSDQVDALFIQAAAL
jgi:hypothetical protein